MLLHQLFAEEQLPIGGETPNEINTTCQEACLDSCLGEGPFNCLLMHELTLQIVDLDMVEVLPLVLKGEGIAEGVRVE